MFWIRIFSSSRDLLLRFVSSLVSSWMPIYFFSAVKNVKNNNLPIEVFIEFNSKKFASVVKPNSFIQTVYILFHQLWHWQWILNCENTFLVEKNSWKNSYFQYVTPIVYDACVNWLFLFVVHDIANDAQKISNLSNRQISVWFTYLHSINCYNGYLSEWGTFSFKSLAMSITTQSDFHEWKAHFDHVNWYLATNYVECRLVRLRSSYTKSAIKRWTAEWTIEIQILNHRS